MPICNHWIIGWWQLDGATEMLAPATMGEPQDGALPTMAEQIFARRMRGRRIIGMS